MDQPLEPIVGLKTNRLLRLREVEQICGIKRSLIYRQMNDGKFPKSVQAGPKSLRWRLNDIQAWIDGLQPKD